MINLEEYTTSLVERDGILFTKEENRISYPTNGNEKCFQIEEDSFWFEHRNNCIVEAVKKYCSDDHFFDVGGGNGFVTKCLEDNGIQTILVEPGVQGCLNARKRGLCNIICSTLENVFFLDNRIPSIGLFDVVEHIEDDIVLLKYIHKCLKENGCVFITVPAYNTLWSNEDKMSGHFRRYTIKELENKLKNVGFAIEYSTYIFSILPIPIFLFRTVLNLLGLNKKSNDIRHKNEHKRRTGIIDKILKKIWNFELEQIRVGNKILFGGSCLVIARKK